MNATSAFVNRAFYVKFVESVKGFSVQYLSSERDIIMYEQTRNKLQYTFQNPEKMNLFLSWRIQPGEASMKIIFVVHLLWTVMNYHNELLTVGQIDHVVKHYTVLQRSGFKSQSELISLLLNVQLN